MILKHGTSSVFVVRRLAEGWRTGLIKHPRLDRMMQPGGHVEPDESPDQAALREVMEEAGLPVRLISPPAAPLPAAYRQPRVAQPWWMVEYQVPADDYTAGPHVHTDHLYVGLAESSEPVSEPAHPFGWFAAADLPGLHMFDDARILTSTLLAGLDGAGVTADDGEVAAAILAQLQVSARPVG